MLILTLYILLFIFAYIFYQFIFRNIGDLISRRKRHDYNERKTVTFGDESAVKPNRVASILSIITLFVIWAAFTGSNLIPLHVPGPFTGETSFTYNAINAENKVDQATVYVRVGRRDETFKKPDISQQESLNNTGFAKDDALKVTAWRSALVRVKKNDEGGKDKNYRIVEVNKKLITETQPVRVNNGVVSITSKGSLSFVPDKGWQMEPIWLPAPENVVSRLIEISQHGYQNISLTENIGWSLLRVLAGFLLGSLVGIPLGYAMGLNGWFRGWFDPIVEFMRPIPPLALIPLIIIWFGIWETGKISLLFLAALWIMTIAARAGVSGVNISKVHAAYSLGASRFQVLLHVIIPNSLPDIFTGARVAMGVCWGTVVAAELVAAEKGAGKMIISASKFQQTDVVIMGIILIGIIGYGIDVLMRMAEKKLVPWKGKT
ncbi:MAG: ABC transporter permease subunit [Gammaproteobacteria bacterium]|nr:ABC transporter permease subunit [Gammaproteobacteria bacterium]